MLFLSLYFGSYACLHHLMFLDNQFAVLVGSRAVSCLCRSLPLARRGDLRRRVARGQAARPRWRGRFSPHPRHALHALGEPDASSNPGLCISNGDTGIEEISDGLPPPDPRRRLRRRTATAPDDRRLGTQSTTFRHSRGGALAVWHRVVSSPRCHPVPNLSQVGWNPAG